MLDRLEDLRARALAELGSLSDLNSLEAWRVRHLGRKSELTQVLRGLAVLFLEERRQVGAKANELRELLEQSLVQKEQALRESALASLAAQPVDVTLPGRPPDRGRLHPTTQTIRHISNIFVSMGFEVVEGPEVEWDYYNFEALNIPEDHP
ncbi:MAG: phenylalanine--tRNA ligase subunit alpha, partial [Chloroflexi bacterium]|nr:phenylalanine--tRNA ligase subunit alpha [Chloroflexota bacterium]